MYKNKGWSISMINVNERIAYLGELIKSCHKLYLWSYDADFQFVSSNCEEESGMEALLNMDQMKKKILTYCTGHVTPIIITNTVAFMWIAEPVMTDEALTGIQILGPFFIDEVTRKNVLNHLNDLHLSVSLRADIARFVRSLPIVSLSRVFEYSQMLHYAATGEKISVSDLRYETSPNRLVGQASDFADEATIHGTYEAEQEMLRMVREGDLNYAEQLSKMATMGNMGKLANDGSGRQFKNAVLVCITLFSRAAIEGGLSPETAMSLTDKYFQEVEACTTIPDLTLISKTMQRDFVERVHKCRMDHRYPKVIRHCIDYIELHLEEKINLSDLSESLGYTEYYLSRKFKEETGVSIKEYTNQKRIERASFLLANSTLSIHDISEKLKFHSQSYFTEQFRKLTGVSPAKYREENRHL